MSDDIEQAPAHTSPEQGVMAVTRDMQKTADLSDCGLYRYSLGRLWNDEEMTLCWIMLNPSTADAEVDDPTIRRCIAFSKAWGYGSLTVVNLFALRATNPRDLLDSLEAGIHPVGPHNDRAIENAVLRSNGVIAAWGTKGTLMERDYAVTNLVTKKLTESLYSLGLTKDGHPKHPLYVKGDTSGTLYRRFVLTDVGVDR